MRKKIFQAIVIVAGIYFVHYHLTRFENYHRYVKIKSDAVDYCIMDTLTGKLWCYDFKTRIWSYTTDITTY